MTWPFGPAGPVEERSISSLPWNVTAGPSGNGLTSALSLVPVFGAVRDISEGVAGLPVDTFRKVGEDSVPAPNPSFVPKPALIPGVRASGETKHQWLQRAVVSMLLRGNAYGLLSGFGVAGEPTGVRWLNPDAVTYNEASDRFFYQGRQLDDSELLHIPGLVVPGKRLGVTPITACRNAVEAGLSIQDSINQTFRNRAVPSLRMKNNRRTLKATEASKVKERLKALVRAGEPIVLGSDWDLETFGPSAEDAAFVVQSRLNATHIAVIFGLPPERIGGETGASMTYSTTELQGIEFLGRSLMPWILRLEEALSSLLPQPRFVKLNVDSVVRIDSKTRWANHATARQLGARSVNEIRRLEDEQPIGPGGDDYTPLKTSAPPAPPADNPNPEGGPA